MTNSDRQLDAEVAERLFNAKLVHVSSGYGTGGIDSRGVWSESSCKFCGRVASDQDCGAWQERCIHAAARYSSDISSAMKVVEKMRNSQEWCCITLFSDYNYIWKVSLSRAEPENAEHKVTVFEVDESLPVAICRAALAALEGKT